MISLHYYMTLSMCIGGVAKDTERLWHGRETHGTSGPEKKTAHSLQDPRYSPHWVGQTLRCCSEVCSGAALSKGEARFAAVADDMMQDLWFFGQPLLQEYLRTPATLTYLNHLDPKG